MDVERERTDSTSNPDDDAWEHACPLLSEAALSDWTCDEEDGAWTHLQQAGLPGQELIRFVGTISPEDLDEMEQIIEEECERIDPDGW